MILPVLLFSQRRNYDSCLLAPSCVEWFPLFKETYCVPRKRREPLNQRLAVTYQEPLNQSLVVTYQEPLNQRLVVTYQEPLNQRLAVTYQEPLNQRLAVTYQEPLNERLEFTYQEPLNQRLAVTYQEPAIPNNNHIYFRSNKFILTFLDAEMLMWNMFFHRD
jgi:hypothetical protein